jgi:hypothetical protein
MPNIEQGISNDERRDPLHMKDATGTPSSPGTTPRSKFVIRCSTFDISLKPFQFGFG